MTVSVTIDAILLYCDESITRLAFGNGYSIKKVNVCNLPFKNKVTDGNGQLTISYFGSRIVEPDDTVALMILHKEDEFQIQLPTLEKGGHLTDSDLMCADQLEAYKDKEMEFLNNIFAMLRLYKRGNIGPKEVFFEHNFTVMGLMNNTQKQTSDNVTRNIVDSSIFSISPDETDDCNCFLERIASPEFLMLKDSIDEFIWGLEQVDIPTGFEQYTTALEMTLLETNQKCKKEALSKRTAVLLETDNVKITALYAKMKDYYRYRSESLHEGDGRNITIVELRELEDIVRRVLRKYLDLCKDAIRNSPTVTWVEVKSGIITDLKNTVTNFINSGVLPH